MALGVTSPASGWPAPKATLIATAARNGGRGRHTANANWVGSLTPQPGADVSGRFRPDWKCGMGQPIEGSNPSLSATTWARIGRQSASRLAEGVG